MIKVNNMVEIKFLFFLYEEIPYWYEELLFYLEENPFWYNEFPF